MDAIFELEKNLDHNAFQSRSRLKNEWHREGFVGHSHSGGRGHGYICVGICPN